MPSRRRVLGTGVALAGTLAGCVSPFGSTDHSPTATLNLKHVSDGELATEFVERQHVSPQHLRAAIDADRVVTTAPHAVAEGGVGRSADGRYYELRVEDSAPEWTERAIGFVARDGEGDPSTVASEELSPVDRAVVNDAFDAAQDEESSRTFEDGTTAARATTAVYGEAEASRSSFVDGSVSSISYGGSTYDVLVELVNVVPGGGTIRAELVAEDTTSYADRIRREDAVALTDLSQAEREVVEAAIDGEYETGENDDAFESVVDRIRPPSSSTVTLYDRAVVYDGEAYLADAYLALSYVGEGE